jgi:hypothetical protein
MSLSIATSIEVIIRPLLCSGPADRLLTSSGAFCLIENLDLIWTKTAGTPALRTATISAVEFSRTGEIRGVFPWCANFAGCSQAFELVNVRYEALIGWFVAS